MQNNDQLQQSMVFKQLLGYGPTENEIQNMRVKGKGAFLLFFIGTLQESFH